MTKEDIIKEKQAKMKQTRERDKALAEFRNYIRENVCRGMTILEKVEAALENRLGRFTYLHYLDTDEDKLKELHWWMRESPYSEYIRADSYISNDKIVLELH